MALLESGPLFLLDPSPNSKLVGDKWLVGFILPDPLPMKFPAIGHLLNPNSSLTIIILSVIAPTAEVRNDIMEDF